MAGINVETTGLAELAAAFQRAPEVTRTVVGKVLSDVLELAVDEIKVDYRSGGTGNVTTSQQTKVVTDNLRNSYGVVVEKKSNSVEARFGLIRTVANAAEFAKAGAYGMVHELGSAKRKIPARPAVNPVGRKQPAIIERELVDALAKAVLA